MNRASSYVAVVLALSVMLELPKGKVAISQGIDIAQCRMIESTTFGWAENTAAGIIKCSISMGEYGTAGYKGQIIGFSSWDGAQERWIGIAYPIDQLRFWTAKSNDSKGIANSTDWPESLKQIAVAIHRLTSDKTIARDYWELINGSPEIIKTYLTWGKENLGEEGGARIAIEIIRAAKTGRSHGWPISRQIQEAIQRISRKIPGASTAFYNINIGLSRH
jgi:hypothetical protein